MGDISGGPYQPFYLKVNKEGQALEWAADISNQFDIYVDDFMYLDQEENMSLVCFDFNERPFLSGSIIEYDKNMAQISYVTMPYSFWFPFTALQETDSTFYVCGNELYEPNPDIRNFGILKMHSDGTVLHEYIYVELQDSCSHVAHFNCLDRLPDENLIVCTSYNLTGTFIAQQEPSYIRLYKFTPELDIIWQRYIGGDAMYEAYSMHAAPDGGVVVLGCYSPTPPPNMWQKDLIIFKTDANGLITGIGDENRQIRSSEAILFPNPAHDAVTVDFSRVYHQATFQLIDIGGKTVLEIQLTANRQQVDISGVPTGTYVYRIFNGEGLDERGKVVVE